MDERTGEREDRDEAAHSLAMAMAAFDRTMAQVRTAREGIDADGEVALRLPPDTPSEVVAALEAALDAHCVRKWGVPLAWSDRDGDRLGRVPGEAKAKAIRPALRLIGDVHQQTKPYVESALGADRSIQVGDLGFDYRLVSDSLDPSRHRVVGGNHDDYTRGPCPSAACNGLAGCPGCGGRGFVFANQPPHFLPDFGTIEIAGYRIFFVRGAWSIDWQHRTPGANWWVDEELSEARFLEAESLYRETSPDVVVTHCAPTSVVPLVPFRRLFGGATHATRTDRSLERMLASHRPRLWVFGHFHVSWVGEIGGTTFRCLDELECLDLPEGPSWRTTVR